MNLVINRLDPNVPDPVESRRRAAGRLVRLAYATIVFGVLAFIVIYFGRPWSRRRASLFRFPMSCTSAM